MKSHVKLFTTVLRESGQDCGVNTRQDENYILSRLSKEGDSFLTITLPAFEKGLLRALDEGRVTSDHFQGFRLGRGGLPRLFSGFLRNIFDNEGIVRATTPDVVRNIRRLRQITLLLSKTAFECKPERELAVIRQYRDTDAEVMSQFEPMALSELKWSFDILFSRYLWAVESELRNSPILRGNHGPGAVQDKTGNNARWSWTTWTDRLEAILPVEGTLACNLHDYADNTFTWLSVEQEPPVRVVTVPKTMKGPRVIAIEPVHMQYVQQALYGLFSDVIVRPEHRALNNRMGWLDQTPNRRLSRDWVEYSTIDLSEASDRVSLALVDHLFGDWPLLRDAMLASRSQRAELPTGEIITLRKFASMGSALCFPIESMVFAACAFYAGRIHQGGSQFWRIQSPHETQLGRMPMFRVFGDDIVVPKGWTPLLLDILESFGLKVNHAKSFWTGKFRESCGADWYDGDDVSVVKLRAPFPPNKKDTNGLIRAISLHNHLMEAGMFESAGTVEEILCGITKMYYVPFSSTALGLWTLDDGNVEWKFSRRYHRAEVKAFRPSFRYREDVLDGYGALRKYFGRQDDLVTPWDSDVDPILKRQVTTTDPEHLRYSGRPLRVTINAGFVIP